MYVDAAMHVHTHGRLWLWSDPSCELSILFDLCFMRCDPSTFDRHVYSVCRSCRALCSVLGVGVTVPYRTVPQRYSST
jgi:hypothetical protein